MSARKRQPRLTMFVRPSAPRLNVWIDEAGERSSELRTASLRVSVHHHIDYGPDEWFVSCPQINVERSHLDNVNLEDAKKEALAYLKKLAWRMADELAAAESA